MLFPLGSPTWCTPQPPSPIYALAADDSGRLVATLTADGLRMVSGGAHRVVLGGVPVGTGGADEAAACRLMWSASSRHVALWSPVDAKVVVFVVEELVDAPVGSGLPLPSWVSSTPVSSEPALRRVRLVEVASRNSAWDAAKVVCRYGSAGLLVLSSEDPRQADTLTLTDWDGDTVKRYSFGALAGPPSARVFPGWVRTMAACRMTKLLVALLSSGRVIVMPLATHDSSSPPGEPPPSADVTPVAAMGEPLPARQRRRVLLLPPSDAPATCVAVSPWGGAIAVGDASGDVTVFQFETKQAAVNRKSGGVTVLPHATARVKVRLSMAAWGFPASCTGGVKAVAWDAAGTMVAVGYVACGLGLWSAAGQRLFTSLPDGGPDMLSTRQRPPGTASLAWIHGGFGLVAVPAAPDKGVLRPGPCLLSYPLLVAAGQLQGPRECVASPWFSSHDTLYMLRPTTGANTLAGCEVADATAASCRGAGGDGDDDGGGAADTSTDCVDLRWHTVAVHPSYSASNAPPSVFSPCDVSKLVIGGWRGFAVLDVRADKWRLFGDVEHERDFHLMDAAWWLHKHVVALVQRMPPPVVGDASTMHSERHDAQLFEVRVYPSSHLDDGSMLVHARLPPTAVPQRMCLATVVGHPHRLVGRRRVSSAVHADADAEAAPPPPPDAKLRVTWLAVLADCDPAETPVVRAPHTAVREAAVPRKDAVSPALLPTLREGDCVLWRASSRPAGVPVLLLYKLTGGPRVTLALHHTQVLPLHALGALSVSLLAPRGGAGEGVSALLPTVLVHTRCGAVVEVDLHEGTHRTVAHGVQAVHCVREAVFGGNPSIQVVLMQAGTAMQAWSPAGDPGGPSVSPDPVLVFDSETVALGVHPSVGAMLTGTTRHHHIRLTHSSTDVFEPHTEVRPCLHALLRVYLHLGYAEHAQHLADSARAKPVAGFAQELERLLHSVLEDVMAARKAAGGGGKRVSRVLEHAVALVQSFPEHLLVFGQVGRKMEPSRAEQLFAVAGDPLRLFQRSMKEASLDVAASYLLLVLESTMASAPADGGELALTDSQRDALKLVASCGGELVTAAHHAGKNSLAAQVARFLERVDVALADVDVDPTPPSPTSPLSSSTTSSSSRSSSSSPPSPPPSPQSSLSASTVTSPDTPSTRSTTPPQRPSPASARSPVSPVAESVFSTKDGLTRVSLSAFTQEGAGASSPAILKGHRPPRRPSSGLFSEDTLASLMQQPALAVATSPDRGLVSPASEASSPPPSRLHTRRIPGGLKLVRRASTASSIGSPP